jgi:hypothetical protein
MVDAGALAVSENKKEEFFGYLVTVSLIVVWLVNPEASTPDTVIVYVPRTVDDGTFTVKTAELPADTGFTLKVNVTLEADDLADNVTVSL